MKADVSSSKQSLSKGDLLQRVALDCLLRKTAIRHLAKHFLLYQYILLRRLKLIWIYFTEQLLGCRRLNEVWIGLAQRWGSWGGSQSSRDRSNPLTHVLINAMGQAAGGTLSEHAKRAGKRRESSWGGSSEDSWDGWSDDSDDDRKKKRRRREYD